MGGHKSPPSWTSRLSLSSTRLEPYSSETLSIMSANASQNQPEAEEDDEVLLDAADAEEEIDKQDEEDHHMDSDPDEAEELMELQNDSSAHFDAHTDSIFCIAQHPKDPAIVATGGGDDLTYVWNAELETRPLPASYETAPSAERASLQSLAKLAGHTDSINALTFTLPNGAYLLTGGLDGQVRVHDSTKPSFPFITSVQEVPEINFLAPCPGSDHPDTFALGASDGSVWVYSINAADNDNALQVVQAYYMHTESCTAGAWTPDGNLLATVSEDGSLYIWDPFGAAAAAGVSGTGQTVVGLTIEDQRFAVEGGLYSVAIAPNGAIAAVGGAGGHIRIVSLPRFHAPADQGSRGGGAKNKNAGGKKSGGPSAEGGQAGQILASLQTLSDGVETLSFSHPPLTLLAAGSVDGGIALFDYAHRFAVRRHIKEAHEEFAVVKVDFMPAENGKTHVLTSCGMDGVVRRWDVRGGTAAGGQGLLSEWRGHRGDGEKGGILGFVQSGEQGQIVTAGDDGVSLVFKG